MEETTTKSPAEISDPAAKTPRCDVLERASATLDDWMALAKILENEAEFYKSALCLMPSVDIQSLRQQLEDIPNLVLENEKKNPAWSNAEIWGIERDIIPSIRALCMAALAILPKPQKQMTHDPH